MKAAKDSSENHEDELLAKVKSKTKTSAKQVLDTQGLSLVAKCGILAVVVLVCIRVMRGRSRQKGGLVSYNAYEKGHA